MCQSCTMGRTLSIMRLLDFQKILIIPFFLCLFAIALPADAQIVNPSQIDRSNIVTSQTSTQAKPSGFVNTIGVILRVLSGVIFFSGIVFFTRGVWVYWLASNINSYLIAGEQGMLKALVYIIVATILYVLSRFLIA